MKKLTTLLGLLAVIAVAVLASCQKENQNEASVTQQNINNASTEINSRMQVQPHTIGPITFGITGYAGGCFSGFGICDNDWFPYPWSGDIGQLDFNQAMGEAFVGEDGSFNIHIDGSTLSSDFLERIANDPTFRISSDYVIPQELVRIVYAEMGLPIPAEGIVFPKGDYPVDIDIHLDDEAQAMMIPWWLFVNVKLDVKYTKGADGSTTVHVGISCC